MSHRTSFKQDNYILKELGSGAYGTVYATIPKPIADQILSELRDSHNPRETSTAKAQLRAAVEAAKISKGGKSFRGNNDCRPEIEVLLALNKGKYPNIVALKKADLSQNGWLTTEPLAGGDLTDFRKLIRESGASNRPPVSLAYHFIHDLAEALLAMHTQGYVHLDLSERNIMLRPLGAYKDYPDVVLVDFGRACNYSDWLRVSKRNAPSSAALRQEFIGMYVQDLTSLQFPLQYSFDQVARNNSALFDILLGIKGYRVRKGASAEEHYVRFLTQLRDEGLKGREREYKILPKTLNAYFQERAKIISDEELEEAFPGLASGTFCSSNSR